MLLEVVGARKRGFAKRQPSRISLALARSLFRPLLPSSCYGGYFVVTSWNSPKNKKIWNLKSVGRKGKTERNLDMFNSIDGVASIFVFWSSNKPFHWKERYLNKLQFKIKAHEKYTSFRYKKEYLCHLLYHISITVHKLGISAVRIRLKNWRK